MRKLFKTKITHKKMSVTCSIKCLAALTKSNRRGKKYTYIYFSGRISLGFVLFFWQCASFGVWKKTFYFYVVAPRRTTTITPTRSGGENEVERQVFGSEDLTLPKRPELYVIWFYALSLAWFLLWLLSWELRCNFCAAQTRKRQKLLWLLGPWRKASV